MNKTLPPVPKSHVVTLFGGVAVVATGIVAWWYGIVRLQARRDERGVFTPWEYRILQAQSVAGNPDRPSMAPPAKENTTASSSDASSATHLQPVECDALAASSSQPTSVNAGSSQPDRSER